MTIDDVETTPDGPVEELAFLARSPHRIQLLAQLSREERTRRDLQETTGISQPTLGRILGDFEQRGWISNNHNGAFNLTPLGELLADEVSEVLDVIETIDQLADLAGHLPFEQLDFDLNHLTDATITTPTSADPLAHMRRFDELADHATTAKMFSNVISCTPAHEPSDADKEFLADVDELVVTQEALRTDLDDSDLREWIYRRVEDGNLSLYRYEESADLLLGIFDDCVGIVPIDDTGMPCGLIDTEADPIRTWARDTFEEYRETAIRLTPDSLPA
jgi:predicted transcriptional regulator